MEWKFVYDQPQTINIAKITAANANLSHKCPKNKPYISEKLSNR